MRCTMMPAPVRPSGTFVALVSGFALYLISSSVPPAAPLYELAQPIVVDSAGGALQIPVGQPVDLLREANGNGDVMIRFVLPNGRFRMALVPVGNIRPRTAHPAQLPTPASTS